MNIYVVKDKLQKEIFIIAKAIFAEIHLSSTPLNLFNDSLHISSTSLTKLASGASLRLMMVMLLVLMMRMGMRKGMMVMLMRRMEMMRRSNLCTIFHRAVNCSRGSRLSKSRFSFINNLYIHLHHHYDQHFHVVE